MALLGSYMLCLTQLSNSSMLLGSMAVSGSHMLCFTKLSASITLTSSMALLGSRMLSLTQLSNPSMLLGSMVVAGSHMLCFTQLYALGLHDGGGQPIAGSDLVLSCLCEQPQLQHFAHVNHIDLPVIIVPPCYAHLQHDVLAPVGGAYFLLSRSSNVASFVASQNACQEQKRERYGWNQTK